jgi:hypothetical protein
LWGAGNPLGRGERYPVTSSELLIDPLVRLPEAYAFVLWTRKTE